MGVRRTVGGVGLRVAAALFRALRGARGTPLGELQPREVLACSPLRIGDAVQVEPSLRALRAAWPDARITLALRPLVHPLGAAFDGVDGVVAYRGARELRAQLPGRPDVAISFGLRFGAAWALWRSGARRTLGYDDSGRGMLLSDPVPVPAWVNRPIWKYPDLVPTSQGEFWLRMLRHAGIGKDTDPVPRLRVPDGDRAGVSHLLEQAGIRDDERVVVCHPGADSSYRWERQRWAHTVAELAEQGLRVVVGGAPSDRSAAESLLSVPSVEAVDLVGRTSLPLYLALLERAQVVVAVDTSATHLAAAVGTPVVALFGAGDPRIWAPAGPGHAVIQGVNDECYGCKRPTCFRPRHYCMEAVAADEVVRAALERVNP